MVILELQLFVSIEQEQLSRLYGIAESLVKPGLWMYSVSPLDVVFSGGTVLQRSDISTIFLSVEVQMW